MANQVAARLKGDDYQHLYAWRAVLELWMPRKQVRLVTVEDEKAGSVDDVTVQHEAASGHPDRFEQIKYHVDHRDVYSTQALIAHDPNGTSLLQKFWRTWQSLRAQRPGHPIIIKLVSNWTWDTNDKVRDCIDGDDNGITEDFLRATPRSEIGKLRKAWQSHLGADDAEFEEFVRSLRFRLGFDCTIELEQQVIDRMETLGLRYDGAALLVAVGIVRSWVKSGKQELTAADLEAAVEANNLRLPEEEERGTAIYLVTVKSQKFDIAPDYALDWRDLFEGDLHMRGHETKDPDAWNAHMLPELRSLEAQVSQDAASRLIRARGLARLSAWLAFGFTFPETARYVIEADQYGKLWRTDATPSDDFEVVISNGDGSPEGETLEQGGRTVAVGISVTGSLEGDVRDYIAENSDDVASVLFLRPTRELGPGCIRGDGDLVALAWQAKEKMAAFVKARKASRMLLFYYGPSSGACFIGHKLNAVCREIQIMENTQPGYIPSFSLH